MGPKTGTNVPRQKLLTTKYPTISRTLPFRALGKQINQNIHHPRLPFVLSFKSSIHPYLRMYYIQKYIRTLAKAE